VEGNLGPDRSFYFRGPDNALNLRAQNLLMFLQIGEGVDDATWRYHLTNGDFARWLRDEVKSDALADVAEQLASEDDLGPAQGRKRLREAVEERYTLPAEPEASATDPSKFG
jgi:hypothetical protein